MINKIKGAIFDLDGTLVDSLGVWEIMWTLLGKRFLNSGDFRPSSKEDKAVRTMTLKDAMKYIHLSYNMGKDGEEVFNAANDILENFYKEDVRVKEGVIPFLDYCYKKGIKMCVASATDINFVRMALKNCGIEKYFTDVLSCAQIGKGKDNPDIYLTALELLSTPKEETCVFEDSAVAINTADKIGLKTVGIYDRYNYGQDEIRQTATEYIAAGETLEKLID